MIGLCRVGASCRSLGCPHPRRWQDRHKPQSCRLSPASMMFPIIVLIARYYMWPPTRCLAVFECSSLGFGAIRQGLGLERQSRSSKTRAVGVFGRSFLHGVLNRDVRIRSKWIKPQNCLVVACCAISALSTKERTLADTFTMSQAPTNHTARRTALQNRFKPIISRSSIIHTNL
jgi:hypothetical protein